MLGTRGAIRAGRLRLYHGCIQRRRVLEIKGILERVCMLIAQGQVQPTRSADGRIIIQEALFNERQKRCVVCDGMRHVVWFGEWRNDQKWHTEAELIETGATVGILSGWALCQGWT